MSIVHVVAVAALVVAVWILITVRRMEFRMTTNQQRLDAIGTQLGAIASQSRKAYNEITTKIEALKMQSADLDFSGLEAAVAQLGVTTDALDGIVPDEIEAEDPSDGGGTPEPAPTPEPEPAPEESETPSDSGDEAGEGTSGTAARRRK